MILVCESCDHGYSRDLAACPWCGASAEVAHLAPRAVAMCDTECYKDYWLCKLDPGGDFQQFSGHPLDVAGLRKALSKSQIITFNGLKYDAPMIAYALAGADNLQLKAASDRIILDNLQPWQFYDHFRVDPLDWTDHIDMIEVAPGQGSLKMYGGKMHSRKLQDLPIEPDASIGLFDRCTLREYCQNDLDTTRDLYNTFPAQLELRSTMSAEYGVDLHSKSDAQIAEAVMKAILPFKPQRPTIPPGTMFYYQPPEWLRFQRLDLLDLLARNPFTIADSGAVEMSKELAETRVTIGATEYQMGVGGLHSCEHRITRVESLQDVDVEGYYPNLVVKLGVEPPQLRGHFQPIYRRWKDERTAAKKAGNKPVANSRKTLNNGTFGKLGSKWSIFYSPTDLVQVTVTGQLALLMLIEVLEAWGIPIISANTDGIVIAAPKHLEASRDRIIAWWQGVTGFTTEANDYQALYSRDVNNYIAIKTDGSVKLKGAFAPPEPGASGWPNPTGQICVDAVVAHLTTGADIALTILGCRDIRRFVHVRQVKGGGTWRGEYLGKAVRWYYSTDGDPIHYKANGNKVATSDGCKPCMTLPDTLPDDIDYARYVSDAVGMLRDIGK